METHSKLTKLLIHNYSSLKKKKITQSIDRGCSSVAINTEVLNAGIVPKYWHQSNPSADRWSFHYSQLNLLRSTSSQPGKHTNLSECFYAAKQTIIHSKSCLPFSHMDRILSEGCCLWQNHYKFHSLSMSLMKSHCHFNQHTHWPEASAGLFLSVFSFPKTHTQLWWSQNATHRLWISRDHAGAWQKQHSLSLSPSHTLSWRFRLWISL